MIMPKSENTVVASAMRYGLVLGLYFIFKFIVVTFSLKFQALNLVTLAMVIGIPFLVFQLAKKYVLFNSDNGVTFASLWLFVILTFFYASLPEALITYAYLQYINPTFLVDQISVFSDMYSQLAEQTDNATISELVKSVEETEIPTAIQYAFKLIYNNVFVGGIIALIISPILRVRKAL